MQSRLDVGANRGCARSRRHVLGTNGDGLRLVGVEGCCRWRRSWFGWGWCRSRCRWWRRRLWWRWLRRRWLWRRGSLRWCRFGWRRLGRCGLGRCGLRRSWLRRLATTGCRRNRTRSEPLRHRLAEVGCAEATRLGSLAANGRGARRSARSARHWWFGAFVGRRLASDWRSRWWWCAGTANSWRPELHRVHWWRGRWRGCCWRWRHWRWRYWRWRHWWGGWRRRRWAANATGTCDHRRVHRFGWGRLLVDGGVGRLQHERGLAACDRLAGTKCRALANLDRTLIDARWIGCAEAFENDEALVDADSELLASDLFVINGQVDAARATDDDRIVERNNSRLLAGFAYEQLESWHCDCDRMLMRSVAGCEYGSGKLR